METKGTLGTKGTMETAFRPISYLQVFDEPLQPSLEETLDLYMVDFNSLTRYFCWINEFLINVSNPLEYDIMDKLPEWKPQAESASLRNWTDHLHTEAKRLMTKDGTHACLLFLFNKESGLISVNQVPPNIDHEQLDEAIANAISEHDLYGVILISETWAYFVKEKDHTAFQLLDGEMKVSDLNAEDKAEALMVRMENREGGCLVYLDQIIRDKSKTTLKECTVANSSQVKWFE